MKRKLLIVLSMAAIGAVWVGCSDNNQLASTNDVSSTKMLDVAQTSSQLASGTSLRITGTSVDTTKSDGHHGGKRHGHPPIDALNLLAPTNELLAIVDAESAGDIRGFRIFGRGKGTITHYDANGNPISLPLPPDGPQGCSFSGKQFPQMDSILSLIKKTVIDFGSGTVVQHDSITITRSGKIVITRSGTKDNHTEVITFDQYRVNGNLIEGTKTRTSVFDKTTGNGSSTTHVENGKITFADGTVAVWQGDKSRVSAFVLDTNGKPASGTITTEGATTVVAGSTTIYSHTITKPLIEDISCRQRHRGPVSGVIETKYRDNTIVVDFGGGSCSNKTVSITLNGVAVTKTVGE